MPGGIWFLLCLFWVNIMAYTVLILVNKTKYPTFLFTIGCLIGGIIGFLLGRNNINFPMFLDSAFSALPFFAFGELLRKNTNFLESKTKPYLLPLLASFSFIVVYIIATGKVNYRENLFTIPFVSVYACGIIGTMGVLCISKWIKKLPIVSYMGRYSIIVLCTHQLVIMPLHSICEAYQIHGFNEALLVWFITSVVCCLLIEPMRRFMPYVTAQKELIPYKPKQVK